MFDPLTGGILGSLIGGLFRLGPEVLKWVDKKNERQHELAMFKERCDLEKSQGEQRLKEINANRDAAVDTGVLSALKSTIDQQTEMVKAAGSGKIAALSASVRPVITYFILSMWACMHVFLAFNSGLPAQETFKLMMTPDFSALVAGTINYWFLDRTLTKRGL